MRARSDAEEQKDNAVPAGTEIDELAQILSGESDADEIVVELLRKAHAELSPEERQAAIDAAERVLRESE